MLGFKKDEITGTFNDVIKLQQEADYWDAVSKYSEAKRTFISNMLLKLNSDEFVHSEKINAVIAMADKIWPSFPKLSKVSDE
jgi:hypothetical protein